MIILKTICFYFNYIFFYIQPPYTFEFTELIQLVYSVIGNGFVKISSLRVILSNHMLIKNKSELDINCLDSLISLQYINLF